MNNLKTTMSTTGPIPTPVASTTKTTNYKDRLCGIVSSGDSKNYLGKEYTIKDIEVLSPADQEKLFQRYQVKFGREVITTVGQSILHLYARAIGLTLPVQLFKVSLNSEEQLTEDLSYDPISYDPIINNSMASALSKVCYKYRVYLSPLVATLITTKHLNSDKKKRLYNKGQQ